MNAEKVEAAPLETAVLFLVFNRPDTTARVFESIRQARPPRLYVAADGPRPDRPSEAEKCAQVRQIATSVDWPCEIKTLFRDKNLGCKLAVSNAITWFFEQEEQGIILEDDCLPHPDFFIFCEPLLEKYKNNERIFAITGCNFQNGQWRSEYTYFFFQYGHIWGWASWRRAWQYYDLEMAFWPIWKKTAAWKERCADPVERRYWEKTFDRTFAGLIDTWDYQWAACVWRHAGLVAAPNVNLVSNIGVGADATHTTNPDAQWANMKTQALPIIVHPKRVERNIAAERYVFDHHFGGRWMRWPWVWLYLFVRVAGWLRRRICELRYR